MNYREPGHLPDTDKTSPQDPGKGPWTSLFRGLPPGPHVVLDRQHCLNGVLPGLAIAVDEIHAFERALASGRCPILVGDFDEASVEDLRISLEPVPVRSRCQALATGATNILVSHLSEAGWVVRRQTVVSSDDPLHTVSSLPAEPTLLLLEKTDYRVCPANSIDEPAIRALFEASFHSARHPEHWHWKYTRNPYGNRHISLCWAPDRSLVGHYAAYPVLLDEPNCNRPLPIHQVGDTMTARGHRHVGRGPTSILGRTARHFYASFCDQAVAFNYGFNTGNIQKFSIGFVGAQKVEEAPYRCSDLPTTSQSNHERGLVKRIDGINSWRSALDAFYEQARAHYELLILRDAKYLDWRYFEAPEKSYRFYALIDGETILGWSCFKRRAETLVWGDAMFLPEAAGAASRLVERAAQDLGCGRVIAWFPSRPEFWARELDAMGLHFQPEPQQLGMVVVPFLDPDPVARLSSNWYYTYGDSDLF